MNRKFACVLSVLLFAMPSAALADGLFLRLPDDGTFATYTMNVNAGGAEIAGEFLIQSVGKETVEGKECRWIEAVMEGGGQRMMVRMLVAEDQLKAGGDILKNAEKAFVSDGQSTNELTDRNAQILGPMTVFLGAALDKSEKLESTKVTTEAGEFQSDGVKGNRSFKQGDVDVNVDVEYRHADTKEAGFGVVEFKLSFTLSNGQRGEAELKLKEVGEGAKSKIETAGG